MNQNTQTHPIFHDEPTVELRPLRDQFVVRFLQSVLFMTLLAGLCICVLALPQGAVSLVAYTLKTLSPPEGRVVVAKHDLKPYQRLRKEDVELGWPNKAVEGTGFTNIEPQTPQSNQAIVLQAYEKGEALTVESVVSFPATVILTNTVIFSIPWPPEKRIVPTLQPGLSVLVIGTTISETSVYSVTAPLIDVNDEAAIVAVPPEVAARLSLYRPPSGTLTLSPPTNR